MFVWFGNLFLQHEIKGFSDPEIVDEWPCWCSEVSKVKDERNFPADDWMFQSLDRDGFPSQK